MSITQTAAWQNLAEHFRQTRHLTLKQRFAAEPQRFAEMHEQLGGLLFDYSKNLVGEDTLQLLCGLAETAKVAERAAAVRSGAIANTSEQRAVLHTALRLPEDAAAVCVRGENMLPLLHRELSRALEFADAVRNGGYRNSDGQIFTDWVHIGIGGSDLGPRLAAQALAPYRGRLKIHFAANADPAELENLLAELNPHTTFFSVASKTFGTPETLLNARSARNWLIRHGIAENSADRHFAAVSANTAAAADFGIPAERVFAMFDWVGGRYSVWSAVGLPVMAAVGSSRFREFLAGAHAADKHFADTPYRRNIPVLMALLGIWYNNFHGAPSHAVVPYSRLLRGFPNYLQQTDMESSGKRVRFNGEAADYATGPIIWGGEGVNCQHAFFQLLHQGTHLVPLDFIVPMQTAYGNPEAQRFVVANAFAQAEALMNGRSREEAEALFADRPSEIRQLLSAANEFEGNRPSNMLLIDRLTPYNLGILLAVYEHKILVQSLIWDINAYDQWGVEYGKMLAKTIVRELESGQTAAHDASTAGLIRHYLHHGG